MIRLDHDRRATAQPLGDQRRDVTKIHHGSDLHALVRSSKTKIVDGVVRDSKRMKIDLANAEVFARFDLLDAIAQRFDAPARLITADVEPFAYVSVESLCGDVNGTID